MSRPDRAHRTPAVVRALLAALVLVACRQDMHDQPRLEPLEGSSAFADGRGSRHPPAGTVARGSLPDDPRTATGRDADGAVLRESPVPLTRALLDRGRDRFEVFCAPCHGLTGRGGGPVVQRGFPAPPDLTIPRLADAPEGHLFDVVTNGFGRMRPLDHLLPPDDRWAVAAHVRALQLAASVPAARLDEHDLAALDAGEAAR